MKKLLTLAEKEKLQTKITRLEQAFDRARAAHDEQDLLFAEILQQMECGDHIRLPDGRTFEVCDPYTITDCGESLPMMFVQGRTVARWSWEIRNTRELQPAKTCR